MLRIAGRASLVVLLALAALPAQAQAQARTQAQAEARIAAQILAQGSAITPGQADLLAPIVLRLRREGYEIRQIRRTWLGRLLLLSSNGERLREVVVNRRNGEVMRDRTFSETAAERARPGASDAMGGNMGGGDEGGDEGDGMDTMGGGHDDGASMGGGMGNMGNMGNTGGGSGSMGPGR